MLVLYAVGATVVLTIRRVAGGSQPVLVGLLGAFVVLACAAMILSEDVQLLEYGLGYCRDCGYNLTGLTTDRCPECGRTIQPIERRSDETEP